ncbi:hypothetical protein EKH79_04545 [Dyella dinghuensis]|uniref:Uncharacterized protein n=1 Tax=Dyella dinghuensis TaxID=1920169 RepID=A0A432LX19_9GAMM|nr:hypothetical protein [Dyella dinghuensis]RUL65973.1 hypothetical protein EKH79_04545 [Dyella dinghuensis]
MPITYGCDEQKKIHLLTQYRLYPVVHTVLLRGRSITCCCGQAITGEFYQFDAIDLAGNILNVLFASDACAQDLLRLSQTHGSGPITLLPLFNPMQQMHREIHDESVVQEHSSRRHPLNAEVEEAIYLAVMCEDWPPQQRRVFTELLDRIRRNPTQPVMDWEVKTMNTAISKGGKCLAAMLNVQRERNAGLKHYAFPEISAALKREAARTGLRIHCNL